MANEGWAWPVLAKGSHYFRDGMSLCGRWMFTGDLSKNQAVSHPKDCKVCRRKLEKETKVGS